MTKKENLYINILNVRNDYYQFSGKADSMINVSEYRNTWAFRSYIEKRKVSELETELQIAERALKEAKEENERLNWFLTEDGKAFKEKNEKARELLHQQILTLREDGYEHTRKVIKALLGHRWDVISFNSRSMEIGLVENYREDGSAKGLFGHEFNVYFDKDFFEEKFRWEMNYGTLGSFNLGEDENRIELLVGMAKFASDNVVVPALREYLQGMVKSIAIIQEECHKLEEEYKHPKMEAA